MSIDSTLSGVQIGWDEAVREFLLHLQATRAKQTVRFYRVQMKGVVRWAIENQITFSTFGKRHMDRYLAFRIESGTSPTTLRHDAVCMKAFLKWCAKNDLIERSSLADYEIRRAPAPARHMPTDEDVRGLLAALHDYWSPTKNTDVRYIGPLKRIFHRDRNYALVLGLLDSACRIGEMLNLKTGDYRESERMIYITQSKGRKPRPLPVSPEWETALSVWMKLRAKIMAEPVAFGATDEGWLFISETGAQIDDARFRKSLKSYIRWANLPDSMTLHSLRRFSLNKLAKINLLAAQAIAGHQSPSTTILYTKLDPDFLREVHASVGVVRGVVTFGEENKQLISRRRRLL